jgi:hypothetical protein
MKRTIRQLRRQELAREIAEYASERAGTSADLDIDLEAAGIESQLLSNDNDQFDPAAGRE